MPHAVHRTAAYAKPTVGNDRERVGKTIGQRFQHEVAHLAGKKETLPNSEYFQSCSPKKRHQLSSSTPATVGPLACPRVEQELYISVLEISPEEGCGRGDHSSGT